MAVKYRDYYEILGVKRTAGQDEIQRGYRKLARKFHPDVNKASNAEDKFKEINEAYEVLKDPEKRKLYDQLGSNWQAGQDFRPPPGWQPQDFGGRRAGGYQTEFHWSGGDPGAGGFSDFFESLFGGMGFRQPRGGASPGGYARGGALRQPGADQESSIRISLEDAFHGGTKSIVLQSRTVNPQGQMDVSEKRYDVKIPPGILPHQKIRLSGQGAEGTGGGPRGHLYLRVEIEPHPVFSLNGRDLTMELAVSPWEAVLGADVRVSTLSGGIDLKIPAGAQGGQKLRLRGKGMPNPKEAPGDLYVIIALRVPTHPSEKELALFEELKKTSDFDPRA